MNNLNSPSLVGEAIPLSKRSVDKLAKRIEAAIIAKEEEGVFHSSTDQSSTLTV